MQPMDDLPDLQEARRQSAARLFEVFIKIMQPPKKPDLKLVHSAPVDDTPSNDAA
jgi:hypothetical protein